MSGLRSKKHHDMSNTGGKVLTGSLKPAPGSDVANWDVTDFSVPEEEGKTRFHDLDLPNQLLHAISDLGFEYCSPIQAAILPHALLGNDAIGKAQTGTGKAAAFLITILNDLILNPISEERFL